MVTSTRYANNGRVSFCRLSPSYRDEYSMIDNHIKAAVPSEDTAAYRAANPVQDGRVVFDEKANEAREDSIVRSLLPAGHRLMIATEAYQPRRPGRQWR